MEITLGIALLSLQSGEGGRMWRSPNPERVVTFGNGGFTVTKNAESAPFLANEDDEGAFDWMVGD